MVFSRLCPLYSNIRSAFRGWRMHTPLRQSKGNMVKKLCCTSQSKRANQKGGVQERNNVGRDTFYIEPGLYSLMLLFFSFLLL